MAIQFLDLPWEVRQIIYRHFFHTVKVHWVPKLPAQRQDFISTTRMRGSSMRLSTDRDIFDFPQSMAAMLVSKAERDITLVAFHSCARFNLTRVALIPVTSNLSNLATVSPQLRYVSIYLSNERCSRLVTMLNRLTSLRCLKLNSASNFFGALHCQKDSRLFTPDGELTQRALDLIANSSDCVVGRRADHPTLSMLHTALAHWKSRGRKYGLFMTSTCLTKSVKRSKFSNSEFTIRWIARTNFDEGTVTLTSKDVAVEYVVRLRDFDKQVEWAISMNRALI